MKIGTKTLLFGNHQFILHPLMVLVAWIRVYRRPPGLREFVCIIIHDWGYWGSPNIDGAEGEEHPELGARIAHWLFDRPRLRPIGGAEHVNYDYYELCRYHSRTLAGRELHDESRLCLADKIGAGMPPAWLLVVMANLTGEIREYRENTKYHLNQLIPDRDIDYFRLYKSKSRQWSRDRDMHAGEEEVHFGKVV